MLKIETEFTKINALELSQILCISEATAKKLAKEGELPCNYVNKRPFFDMNAIINHFKKLEGCV